MTMMEASNFDLESLNFGDHRTQNTSASSGFVWLQLKLSFGYSPSQRLDVCIWRVLHKLVIRYTHHSSRLSVSRSRHLRDGYVVVFTGVEQQRCGFPESGLDRERPVGTATGESGVQLTVAAGCHYCRAQSSCRSARLFVMQQVISWWCDDSFAISSATVIGKVTCRTCPACRQFYV